jgi:CBS domain-containing protein
MICPACGYDNIEGVDVCEECEASLVFISTPQPKSKLERHLWKDRIKLLAPQTPLAVTPDTPVRDVLKLLVNRSIGCLLVVEAGKLVGIFSERDALMRLGADAQALGHEPISKYMTAPVESLGLDDRIVFALHKMDIGGFRHVPIVQDGEPRGVISIRDILRYMTTTILTAS